MAEYCLGAFTTKAVEDQAYTLQTSIGVCSGEIIIVSSEQKTIRGEGNDLRMRKSALLMKAVVKMKNGLWAEEEETGKSLICAVLSTSWKGVTFH